MLKSKEIMSDNQFLLGPPPLFNPRLNITPKSLIEIANLSVFELFYYTLKTCHLVSIHPCDSVWIRCER